MARPLGDEAEYGEGEEEHHSLIELGSGGGGLNKRRPLNGGGGAGALDRLADGGRTGGGPTCRWVSVLFLLALAGVYYLGLAEGKNEALGGENSAEDVESKAREGEDRGHKVLSPKQSPPASQSAPPPPPQPDDGKNEGTFTLEKLKLVREECLKLTSTLEAYYTSVDQTKDMLLVKSWMDGWDFDAPEGEPAKRLRADKLVDTMARALVTDDQSTFLIGGIGSSVMAGHDNCHYDSYNSQMERLWQPVWRAAGMDFVFQNAGEGGSCGDSHQNQVYCVRQNVSPDVDIVHYEWTYFEGGTAAPEHESLIRWTQMMSKQPPVNIYNTGELNQKQINMDKDLIATYAQYGFNAFYMKTSFVAGGYDYDAEKKNPDESKRIDRFSWGYVGDGYHETTRYGEDEEDDARKSSLGVVMRNWHPGPMGFQLTSDAFVYTYTLAVMKALDLIEADMDAGNDPRDKWAASERPLLMKGDLPAPKVCDPEYCVVDEAPGCLNYELPTFGYWGARVEDPDDDLNPYRGEVQNWQTYHDNNDIWHMVGKVDTAVFKNRDDKEMCRHLDGCGGIAASKADDGMVVFRLPKMEVGLVVICSPGGKQVAQQMFIDNVDIEISYNTVPVDPKGMTVWPNGKCVQVNKRFPTSGREAEMPTGHAYLGVKILRDTGKVSISHVITI